MESREERHETYRYWWRGRGVEVGCRTEFSGQMITPKALGFWTSPRGHKY